MVNVPARTSLPVESILRPVPAFIVIGSVFGVDALSVNVHVALVLPDVPDTDNGKV